MGNQKKKKNSRKTYNDTRPEERLLKISHNCLLVSHQNSTYHEMIGWYQGQT